MKDNNYTDDFDIHVKPPFKKRKLKQYPHNVDYKFTNRLIKWLLIVVGVLVLINVLL